MYDINIGLFKASKGTEYRQTEEEVKSAIKSNVQVEKVNIINHKINTKSTPPYECIIDYKLIEKHDEDQDITINYFAKEPGFYRIVFNNDHSWIR